VKERRRAGATHSFRLSETAAAMVDRYPPFRSLEGRPYPRSLGGKSKLVSDAIVWCYGPQKDVESYHEVRESRAWWVARCEQLESVEISGPPTTPRRTILARILSWIRRN
jgi:hypothetical protein